MKRVLLQETDDEIRDDFMWSMECTHELIQEMTLNEMNMGAALGGMLTQTLTALMHLAPDTETAMQVVSSCIHNASTTVEINTQTHDSSDEIH
jgi:hypothetical protein